MFSFFRKTREKITPIDLNNPDAVVTVINCRHSKNPFGKNYRGCCEIQEKNFTSVCFQTIDGNDMIYEQPHRCFVNFLTPEAYPYSLWVGRKIELYEGKYHVGTMVIEEIMNKNLDRNTEFENDKDVLLNPDIINIALKLSLEWGKGFVKPLDIKLMKALPYLSGTDIEKISEYVIQVRDDVLWEIYYPNWDVEEGALKTDAQKATIKKYPWINKDNLASLDSQGKYYAWHG